MSQEPQNSGVTLVMAAYLKELENADVPRQETPTSKPESGVVVLKWLTRVVPVLLIGAVLLTIPVQGMSEGFAREQGRRRCGLDWILWAFGDQRTFEGSLQNALQRSRDDFERRNDFKPAFDSMEVKPFEFNQLQLGRDPG